MQTVELEEFTSLTGYTQKAICQTSSDCFYQFRKTKPVDIKEQISVDSAEFNKCENIWNLSPSLQGSCCDSPAINQ